MMVEYLVEQVICLEHVRYLKLDIPVHAPMHFLSMLVGARAPAVVPQASERRLLLVANNLRNDLHRVAWLLELLQTLPSLLSLAYQQSTARPLGPAPIIQIFPTIVSLQTLDYIRGLLL